jgi:putative redox protein
VKISMDWKGGLKFSGTSRFGHQITTDGSKQAGGKEEGYQPVELVLFGLAGCTGIDVVLIAQKMKQEISGLTINVEAEQNQDFPKFIARANLEYVFTGKELKSEMLEKAITLSQEKYCSVGTTLSGVTKLTHTCVIKEG